MVCVLCGQPVPPPGRGSPSHRTTQRPVSGCCVCPLRRNKDCFMLSCCCCFAHLTAFPLFLRFLTSLTSKCSCLLFGIRGRPFSYKQDTEELLYPVSFPALFTPLCASEFPFGIVFSQFEELPLTFLAVQVSKPQILSSFVCLIVFLFCLYFRRTFF